jgi:2'-5' RNA ligase
MTLLYGPTPIPAQPIEPLRFVVAGFSLIHSELGLTRYNVIDRWSLEGRVPQVGR